MIFSKEKEIGEYAIEKCNKCGTMKKRLFKNGDCLFYETSKCTSCDGMMVIEKIFAEPIEK